MQGKLCKNWSGQTLLWPYILARMYLKFWGTLKVSFSFPKLSYNTAVSSIEEQQIIGKILREEIKNFFKDNEVWMSRFKDKAIKGKKMIKKLRTLTITSGTKEFEDEVSKQVDMQINPTPTLTLTLTLLKTGQQTNQRQDRQYF